MIRNIFQEIPGGLSEEFGEELLRTGDFRLERIVSRGQASPPGFWYDQDHDEWVLLLKGSATLGFADGTAVDLRPGDHLLIPRRVRHRVERTDPLGDTVWLAIHFSRG